jgi:hypothetical protein
MDAKFATQALLNITGLITGSRTTTRSGDSRRRSMLCKPVRRQLAYHIPNNRDITVDYKGGKVVAKGSAGDARSTRRSPDPGLGEAVQAEQSCKPSSIRMIEEIRVLRSFSA